MNYRDQSTFHRNMAAKRSQMLIRNQETKHETGGSMYLKPKDLKRRDGEHEVHFNGKHQEHLTAYKHSATNIVLSHKATGKTLARGHLAVIQDHLRQMHKAGDLHELSTDLLRRYMRKGINQIRAKKGDINFRPKAKRRDKQIDKAAMKVSSRAGDEMYHKEDRELNELSHATLKSYVQKADRQADSLLGHTLKDYDHARTLRDHGHKAHAAKVAAGARKKGAKADRRMKWANHAEKKMEEETELNELSYETLRSYANRAKDSRNKAMRKGDDETVGKRTVGIDTAIVRGKKERAKPQYEETGNLDELSAASTAGYFSRAATDRGQAEKTGDTKRLGRRERGLDRAFERMMRNSPKHNDPRFKNKC